MDLAEAIAIPNWKLGIATAEGKGHTSSAKAYESTTFPSLIRSHFLRKTVESCPRGYPNVAAFLDSDECFAMYRRFGFLQSRLLLDKQDELRELEEALDRVDRREANADPKRPMTRDLPREEVQSRRRLLSAIEEKFCSYGKRQPSLNVKFRD